jgi:hypothetical protein
MKNKVPTLKNVLPTLKEEIKFAAGKKFLRTALNKTAFKCKKCKNKRSFLMERGAESNLFENKLDSSDVYSEKVLANSKTGVMKNDNTGQQWVTVHARLNT